MARWPELREKFAETFATRTRDEWAEAFAGTDACVAPVLSPAEAPSHPHNTARGTFTEVGGLTQPAPAPRFGRSSVDPPAPPRRPGADTDEVLGSDWLELTPSEIADLRARGAVA
jgi:alpha-methylacyl-CoA racemase